MRLNLQNLYHDSLLDAHSTCTALNGSVTSPDSRRVGHPRRARVCVCRRQGSNNRFVLSYRNAYARQYDHTTNPSDAFPSLVFGSLALPSRARAVEYHTRSRAWNLTHPRHSVIVLLRYDP